MFHLQDGWFFQRTANGSVLIRKHREAIPESSPIVAEVLVTPEGWASVVASVCARNETGETWRAALDFHNAAKE